jgi:hypothetical protein
MICYFLIIASEVMLFKISGELEVLPYSASVCWRIHASSFGGELTITVSYAEWLCDINNNGRKAKRHSIDYTD